MGYKVELYRDYTAQEIRQTFENIVTVRSAEFANHDSFVCCIISHGAMGKKIFTSDSLTVDLNDDIASKLMVVQPSRENQSYSSFRPAEEVGEMEVLWSLLESNKFYQCLESLKELTSFLASPLHQTLLHLQKNTGRTGVLLTLRHFAKPSAKMQSACIWWICTP